MLKHLDCTCDRWTALVGRVLIAILFIIAGYNKLMGFEGTVSYVAIGFGGAVASVAAFVTIIAIVVELGGGILLLIGYKTRFAAWSLAIFTILATLGWHPIWSDPNQMTMFLKNLAIAGGLLYVAGFGGGKLSADAKYRPDTENVSLS